MNDVNRIENARLEKKKGDDAWEEADYYSEISFTHEIVQNRIKDVEQFLAKARPYLSRVGVG